MGGVSFPQGEGGTILLGARSLLGGAAQGHMGLDGRGCMLSQLLQAIAPIAALAGQWKGARAGLFWPMQLCAARIKPRGAGCRATAARQLRVLGTHQQMAGDWVCALVSMPVCVCMCSRVCVWVCAGATAVRQGGAARGRAKKFAVVALQQNGANPKSSPAWRLGPYTNATLSRCWVQQAAALAAA